MAVEQCNSCLPLDCIIKVDINVQNVVEEEQFNCLAILTSDPDCGVGLTQSPVNTDECVREYVIFEDLASEWDSSCEVYQSAQHAFAQTPSVATVKVMYFNPAGDIQGQLDALFECENCQGIVTPEIHDDPAIILAIADWVEARKGKNFYFTDTHDPLTLDPNDTTSIAALIQMAGYEYTSAYYHCDENEQFASAALSFGLGQDLDLNGSSFTMAYKELALVNPCFISKSQLVGATGTNPSVGCSADFGHFANVYTCIGNNNVLLYGSMGDGNFFDTALLREFVKARLQEAMAQVFLDGSVPFTDAGISALSLQVEFILSQFQAAGWLTDYVVFAPQISETSVADRACRFLECIQWEANLAGRVHTTCLQGQLNF